LLEQTGAGCALVVTDQPIPLVTDADGVVRVANTRVALGIVIAAFHEGATPETIAQQYPSLALADMCVVIGYYLNHRSKVHAYLQQREHATTQTHQENEVRFVPNGLHERLVAPAKPGKVTI
jgi:uncharacterized protein (DUF433 family)